MSNATHWIEVLDQSKSDSIYAKPKKRAIQRMENAAVGVVEEYGEYVYIFKDGSAAYEKRKGDWYSAGEYVQCRECDEYFKQVNATSGDNLCDECVENRADAVEEAEEVSD
jgi:hypothetical protein